MVFELSVIELIQTVGYAGLFAIVFAESGVFFGFFFPGDSLLFAAGILAGQGFFSIAYLIPLLAIGAILGDSVGYWTGKKWWKRLFERETSRLFKKKRLVQAQEFYKKHGGKTIVIARFMPFIRTFAPIAAGIADMPYRRFVFFNVLGGVFWVVLLTLAGYWLGGLITDIELYILPIVGIIILISLLPAAVHIVVDRKRKTNHVSDKT